MWVPVSYHHPVPLSGVVPLVVVSLSAMGAFSLLFLGVDVVTGGRAGVGVIPVSEDVCQILFLAHLNNMFCPL